MLAVVFCWGCVSLVQLASGLVHANVRLDDTEPSLRHPDASYLSDIGKSSFSRLDPAVPYDSEEEQILIDTGSYDEDVAAVVQLQSRAMRSPRRCIPHQQFCHGHQLQCCNPCDTCYCRFFNANCYCRRVGQACAHGRR